MKKKILVLIIILVGGGIILSACDISSDNDFNLNGNTKIAGQVITSNRPEYVETAPSSMSNKKSVISLRVNSRSPNYIEDEIVVKYEKTAQVSSMNNSLKASGSNVSSEINTNSGRIAKIKIPKNKTAEEMIEYFKNQPGVSYAEPNYIAYAQAVPNDSYYEEYKNGAIGQWGLWAVNMNSAWDDQKSSSSVKVAVVDSGIIPDHPDFDTNDLTDDGANFVGEESNSDPSGYIGDKEITDYTPLDTGSHGTHVAGIIGALTNNSRGISGVSWNVDLMPIRVLDSDQDGNTFDIAEGIYYAADNGADIINLSLGTLGEPTHLEEAVKYAYEDGAGSILIAASGNYENSNEDSVFYPAAYEEVIAVGAVDINNNRTDYSTSGSELDLVAPGGNSNYGILSTWGYDGEVKAGYNYMSGTSMASAFVSGAAALLLESGVSPSNIRNRLTSTAYDLGNNGRDNEYGHGLLDFYGALLDRKTEVPKVFVASKSDNRIYKESTPVEMNSDNSYVIAEEVEGTYYLVAWRDVNENGSIDGGDFFGITDKDINFELDTIYEEQDINMYYVKPDSTETSSGSLSFEVIE